MNKQIKIKGHVYDVLSSVEAVDKYDMVTKKVVGEHTLKELNKIGSKKLSATHHLRIYDDPKKIYLYTLGYKKAPKAVLSHPKPPTHEQTYISEEELEGKDVELA